MLRLPPLPSWSSALIAAFVGFGGTIALVVQAVRAMGASVDQTGSAVPALCLGIAIAGGPVVSLQDAGGPRLVDPRRRPARRC